MQASRWIQHRKHPRDLRLRPGCRSCDRRLERPVDRGELPKIPRIGVPGPGDDDLGVGRCCFDPPTDRSETSGERLRLTRRLLASARHVSTAGVQEDRQPVVAPQRRRDRTDVSGMSTQEGQRRAASSCAPLKELCSALTSPRPVRVIARDGGHVLGEDPWSVRDAHTRVRRSTAVVVFVGSLATLLSLPGSSTAAPQWSQPVGVDGNATGRAGVPSVALGPNGSGVILWLFAQPFSCEGAECVYRVKAITRQSRSQEWSGPVTLADSLSASSVSRPVVAIDGSGEATVAYSEGSGPFSRAVRVVTWQPSSGWGDPVTVSTDPTATSPRIEVNRRGDAVVTWAIAPTQLQTAYRSSGTNEWGAPTTLATYGAGGYVALDERGNAIATWVNDVEKETLASFRPVASGLWRNPVVLSHALGGAHVEFDEAGNALAVWSKIDFYDSTRSRAVAAYRPVGRTWGAPETIARRSLVAGFVVGRTGALVLLARYPSGRLASVQRTNNSGRWRLAGEITPGSRWGETTLAGDVAGDAVVVWNEFVGGETIYDGGHEVVRAAIHPAGSSKWRLSLNVTPDNVVDSTDIDVDAAGNALAAWSGGQWWVARSDMDAGGPLLENVHAPDGRAGIAIYFRATATAWGVPLHGDPLWSFGDGRKARGSRVSHVYRRRGRYVVRVSQTDGAGKTTAATRVVVVGTRKT